MTDHEVAIETPDEGLFGAPVDAHAVFDRDLFLLRQRMMTISERYMVSDEEGRPLMFVRRQARIGRTLLAIIAAFFATLVALFGGLFVLGMIRAMTGTHPAYDWIMGLWFFAATVIVPIFVLVALSPKRHVHFWADETETQALMHVEQEAKWQVPVAWFRVKTPDGVTLARLRKNYLHNFFRRIWTVHDESGAEWLRVYEDSVILSIGRRLFGPMFGLLRANFVFMKPGERTPIGKFDRKFTILDRYALDLRGDEGVHIDRRVAVALGVLLDTAEKR